MHAYYCDEFVLPLPPGHRFPMEKYRLLRERLVGDRALTLLVPEPATSPVLRRVHTDDWVERVEQGRLTRDEVRRIGFPWSAQLVERSRRSVGGTIQAAEAALDHGAAANLAGGTHHAHAERGEGYCVFNDVAVAVRAVQHTGRAHRCAVIDLDVHQGDGTASIFREDDAVLTISVHGAANFPFHKERSDLDLPLDDGADDDAYLDAVGTAVERMVHHAPDLVFYVAGADPYADDRLGRLAVTKRGLRARDALVLEGCGRAGAAVAVVMSGGYARDVTDTIDIHADTVRAMAAFAATPSTGTPVR